MHVTKFSFDGNIPSLFCCVGTNCCTSSGSKSRSYVYSSTSCWAWDFGSCLGFLWCFCPSDLCSCLGEICGLQSDLGDKNFSFCLWCWCCCFLKNPTICWGLILPIIAISSCLICLFYKVSLSSSSLDLDIKIVLLVVLIYSCFSFLGKMCVGFRGFLFLINLSLRLSFLR